MRFAARPGTAGNVRRQQAGRQHRRIFLIALPEKPAGAEPCFINAYYLTVLTLFFVQFRRAPLLKIPPPPPFGLAHGLRLTSPGTKRPTRQLNEGLAVLPEPIKAPEIDPRGNGGPRTD